MNDSQSNRLDMYLVLNEFYLSNQVVLDDIPAITTAFNQLSTNIAAINAEIAEQSSNTTGVTQDKLALRETLDTITTTLLATATVWVEQNGNNTLAAEFDYPLSEIQRIKDDTMQGFCSHRITLINDNLAAMVDFGLDAPAIADWQSALDAYVAAIESPRQAINTRVLSTKKLKDLFTDTSAILADSLDPLMLQFKVLQPDVYEGYLQARIVINRGGTKSGGNPALTVTITGNVSNAQSTSPKEGATIVLLALEPTSTIEVQTDQTGAYTLSFQVEANTTAIQKTIRADALGFISETRTIEVKGGNSYVIDFQLDPEVDP